MRPLRARVLARWLRVLLTARPLRRLMALRTSSGLAASIPCPGSIAARTFCGLAASSSRLGSFRERFARSIPASTRKWEIGGFQGPYFLVLAGIAGPERPASLKWRALRGPRPRAEVFSGRVSSAGRTEGVPPFVPVIPRAHSPANRCRPGVVQQWSSTGSWCRVWIGRGIRPGVAAGRGWAVVFDLALPPGAPWPRCSPRPLPDAARA